MKKNIDILSLIYILFLVLIFLSSALGGIMSYAFYLLAYFLPLMLFLVFLWDKDRSLQSYFSFDKKDIGFVLPIFAPTIFIILSVSMLTSFIVTSLTGQTNSVDLGDSLLMAIVSHALIPAIFEELLFRFLPMGIFRDESKGALVIISALFFALIHHSLFSIPYAFIAGVIFMIVAISTDSILPTIILHFINNTLSILFIFYENNELFSTLLFVGIVVVSVLSLVIIFSRKKMYVERFSKTFKGDINIALSPISISFILFNLLIAVFDLIGA